MLLTLRTKEQVLKKNMMGMSSLFKRRWLLMVTLFVLCISRLHGEIFEDVKKNCSLIYRKEIEINRNEEISCNHGNLVARQIDEMYSDDEETNHPFKCIVTDKDGVVLDSYNDTATLSEDDYDVTGGTFSQLDLQVHTHIVLIAEMYPPGDMNCFCMKFKITEEQCDDVDGPAEMKEIWIQQRRTCDVNCELNCQTPGFAGCYNVSWFQNSTLLDESLFESKKNKSTLTLPVDKITHTNFLCKVSRHGDVISKTHYNICFTGGEMDNDVQFKELSPSVRAQLGSSVKLSCQGTGGVGARVEWLKEGENSADVSLCYLIQGVTSQPRLPNGNCSITSLAEELCSKCRTPETCREKLTGHFTATLQINDVGKGDLGRYKCVAVTTRGNMSEGVVSLIETPSQLSVTLVAVTLVFLASVLLLLLMVSVIIHRFQTELKLIWKRHIADFDPDDRTFGVFLSYCYNSESQGGGTKELLQKLHEWFELKNYFVFDQHRNHSGELRHNLIRRMVPNCHRMVVVLTTDYMINENTVSDANTGIQSSIDGKARLIFIVTPLFRDYFQQQLKAGDASCRAIKMSMNQKRNTVIYWKEKNQDKFFKELDVAMPKLERGRSIHRNGCHWKTISSSDVTVMKQ